MTLSAYQVIKRPIVTEKSTVQDEAFNQVSFEVDPRATKNQIKAAVEQILGGTDGRGVDAAFEVCGSAQAVPPALDALRIGGRYLIAGLVMPDSALGVEGNQITRKCLTIKGIHNYSPEHLGEAVRFDSMDSDQGPPTPRHGSQTQQALPPWSSADRFRWTL